MVALDRIRIQPITSLDSVSVSAAELADSDGPDWDRRYAIVERTAESGPNRRYVSARREPALRGLDAEYDLERETVAIGERDSNESQTFHLELDRDCLASWLSDSLGDPVEIVRNGERGFPTTADIRKPTVVSTATLETVASWYDDIETSELLRRLRPTLVVSGCPAFWEDRLYAGADHVVPFEIGSTTLHGVRPVPLGVGSARDPDTGAETDGFRETFVERRRATLPDWATDSRFDHYFRLAVEISVPDSSRGETLSVGESVTVDAAVPVPTPAD